MAEQQQVEEEVLDLGLAVIDTHHHLHDRAPVLHEIGREDRFLIDDYAAVVGNHNVVATVCVEARAMYRVDGPEEMKVVGETEFLNGQAAMAASGAYGPCRVGAAIVSYADLTMGERVRDVLEAHIAAAPQRFRGIRQEAAWDEDESIVGWLFDCGPGLYLREDFRAGFATLAALGLSFDAFVISPQLNDVVDLARRFADTSIVLNHLAIPVGIGRHAGCLDEAFPQWRSDMTALSGCENVSVKLGGLGSFISGLPSYKAHPCFSSQQLADEWRRYVETAIELFGANRCMFESNLPTDGSGSFSTVCNAFKRLVGSCSETEKAAVFSGTAIDVYRPVLPATS